MNKTQMSDNDFQKLLQIALMDLRIRRTLLENELTQVRSEPRSLEQEERLEELDGQILHIAKDYDHYMQFIDEGVQLNIENYYA